MNEPCEVIRIVFSLKDLTNQGVEYVVAKGKLLAKYNNGIKVVMTTQDNKKTA